MTGPGLRVRLGEADRVVLGIAALVLVLAAVSGGEPSGDEAGRGLDGWAAAILVAASATLLAGRRFPAAAAVVALGLTFAWYGAGFELGLVNAWTVVAYYRLGASHLQGRKVAVVAGSVALSFVNIGIVGDEGLGPALSASAYLVMATLFGELIRSRHLLVEQYADRAERAEADAERRVATERMRIARDVHDVLAHSVSAMAVQAGVAADSLDRDPEAARRAVGSIRQAGREALEEVRATVAVLRTGADGLGTAPAPRIERVGELAAAARDHGIEVEIDLDLSGRPLGELVELTAFRVVQEALTNVVRHADASRATVTIREAGPSLTVEVRDDGRDGGSPISPGFGLRGMAERVESIGGSLHHGRETGCGWVVRAMLPLPRDSRAADGP